MTVSESESGPKPQTGETILEVKDASVTFEMDRGESRVLNDVSLEIYREEILGVVGESGSGKSMFASALLDAVVDPGMVSGEITYYREPEDPVNILNLSDERLNEVRWEEISMVFQGALDSFNPTIRIRTHFKETLKHHDYDMAVGIDRARTLLSDLHLDPERVLDSYPHELSGGMKQRALIALSLVLEPEILVMDEPTAALDLLMQRSILSLLQNLKELYDLTIIFITHDLPLVSDLADRIAVMYAFEFCEIGPIDEVLAQPAHPYTRALFNAVPNLSTPLSTMKSIEGTSPDPVNVPSGCSYHPRCPLADENCRQKNPPYYSVSDDHKSACFHWERALDELSLDEGADSESAFESYEGYQSEDPLVSLDDVKVHFEQSQKLLGLFGESETVQAVDGVELDIYENDVVALVGESGCGKTTLGKAVIGLQRPTDGGIRYRDQDIWEAKDSKRGAEISYQEIRRSLQIIHQDPGASLNPYKTVLSSLQVPLRRWHPDLSEEDRRARVLSMLDYVGMTPPEDYADRYPHQLSGGEKQRVALIRALLMNPDLILADEAVSALDVSLRIEMMDLMHDLQDEFNTSFLFISHNLSNARYLASKVDGRIGVMYLGQIVEIGPAEQIIHDPKHPYTKALKWSTADLKGDDESSELPMRGIDIPDPVDPPSGCRFHTRCPEAREACTRMEPELVEGSDGDQRTACFREYDEDHPYWESESIVEE